MKALDEVIYCHDLFLVDDLQKVDLDLERMTKAYSVEVIYCRDLEPFLDDDLQKVDLILGIDEKYL